MRPALGVAVAAAVLVVSCGGSDSDDDDPAPGQQASIEITAGAGDGASDALVEPTTSVAGTTTPTTASETTNPDETDSTIPEDTEPDDPTNTATSTTIAVPDDTSATSEPDGSADVISLTDDSGRLDVDVPASWADTDLTTTDTFRQISAAPDLPAFLNSYVEPGMLLIVGDAPDPDAWTGALAGTISSAEADGCTVVDTGDYDDGLYTGTEHLLDCGDATTVPYIVGGRNSDGSLFFLLAVITPADRVDIRDSILQSFFID